MVSTRSPYTGFGDDPATAIKFRLLRINGEMPDWRGGPRLVQHELLNSDEVVSQYMGRQPYTVTFLLRFADPADLAALDALQGTPGRVATLRYLWGITKPLDGHHWRENGVDYLVLPKTRLLGMTDDQSRIDGTSSALVTFQRTLGVT